MSEPGKETHAEWRRRQRRGEAEKATAALKAALKRAEAAEAELAEENTLALRLAHNLADRIEEREAECRRAEAAEKKLAEAWAECEDWKEEAGTQEERAADAEAKLAALVRRVRRWMEPGLDGCDRRAWVVLNAVLAEYQPKPATDADATQAPP